MANADHLTLLRGGTDSWNAWRQANPSIKPNLAGAELRGASLPNIDLRRSELRGVDLHGANLTNARLTGADLLYAQLQDAVLVRADLQEAFIAGANLHHADLRAANLSRANLRYVNAGHANLRQATLTGVDAWFALLVEADLKGANLDSGDFKDAHLFRADLRESSLLGARFNNAWLDQADLRGAKPQGASFDSASLKRANLSGLTLNGVDLSADLIETDLTYSDLRGARLTGMLLHTDLRHANLSGCRVYGVSAWDVKLDGADQRGLVITPPNEPAVTVDDLEVAQFLYLLLKNRQIRKVVDTVTAKAVLILGRFTIERKRALDAMRDAFRAHDLLPIVFDFQGPESRDLTETVRTLAHLSRFIVADLTDARSVIQELTTIVPQLPSVPVLPVIHDSDEPWAMFAGLRRYPWVLEPYRYNSEDTLIAAIPDDVIRRAEEAVARFRPTLG